VFKTANSLFPYYWSLFTLGFASLSLFACATVEPTPRKELPVSSESIPISIAVGQFTDTRYRYQQEKFATTEIQIGMNRIKNATAQSLEDSRFFEEIINIPTSFYGSDLPAMLNTARKSKCEYLLIAEVDNFDIKIIGHNRRALMSGFLEPFAFPMNFIVYFSTGGKGGVFFQGIIADRTAMVNFSMTLTLIDIRNGSIVGNFTLEEKVFDTVNYLFYGDNSDSTDDWRDVGKNIGERAMFNLLASFIPKLAEKAKEEVQKIQKKQEEETLEEEDSSRPSEEAKDEPIE
jgi:hypothetical protein